jgi:hypothetical protein
MNRSISTKTHGMIDYSWASTAAAMPKMMTNAPAASRLIQNAGLAAGANTMLTNYEAGVLKLMPMTAHLAFDALIGGALLLAPLFVPASERRYALIPMAFGAVSLFSALMTETRSSTEPAAAFTPSRELSEAVADPDIARTTHLQDELE